MTVSRQDYAYLQALLRRTTANTLDDDKHYLVEARLTPVAHAHDHPDVSALLRAARLGQQHLHDPIVEAMTINETSFFRDAYPFRALERHILPELLARHARPLRMWSAAASTGQEAYSLALLMADSFGGKPAPSILGTDVSRAALERAKAGVYSQMEVNRGLPARLLLRHFTQDGRRWQIRPEIQRTARFIQMNLCQPWPAMPSMDVILLRNVLIYFDEQTRSSVIERVVAALNPGGYLFVGNAETLMVRSVGVERVEFDRSMCFRARD